MATIYKRNNASTLQEIEENRPTYQSDYQTQIDSLLSQIQNRPAFNYQYNADPLYQQYRQQYLYNGERANRDAQASAAQLTGGFGNSYAVTAGSQAQQTYNAQLNSALTDLANAAYSRYQGEGDQLNTRLSQLQSLENADYGRYTDALSAWQTDRDYAYTQYLNELAAAQASGGGSGGGGSTKQTTQTTQKATTAGDMMERAYQVGIGLETADERKAYLTKLVNNKTITTQQATILDNRFKEYSVSGRKTERKAQTTKK